MAHLSKRRLDFYKSARQHPQYQPVLSILHIRIRLKFIVLR